MATIGCGGQGTGDMQGFLGFPQVQMVAVCDVVAGHREHARRIVNERYHNQDCKEYNDFREVLARPDIDAVLIGTPDHWHALLPSIRQEQAQQKWQEICWKTLAPGHEAERILACKFMAQKLGPGTPEPTRVWLLKQLERIGRGECVEKVAAVVSDGDRLVRDAAIRALAPTTPSSPSWPGP